MLAGVDEYGVETQSGPRLICTVQRHQDAPGHPRPVASIQTFGITRAHLAQAVQPCGQPVGHPGPAAHETVIDGLGPESGQPASG